MRKARRTLTTASSTFRGGGDHACCRACYGPVRGAAGFAFCQPVQKGDEGSLQISPFTGSLFLSVVCSAPLLLPCSLQDYRLRCLCPGRNAAWPQRAAASCLAQPRVGCGHDLLQIRDLTELRRLVGACLKLALPKQNADSAKVPDQRSTTTRRYRPSGLQERVRRVVVGTARNPSSRAPVGGHASRRMRPSVLPSPFETPAAKPLPAPHRVRGRALPVRVTGASRSN